MLLDLICQQLPYLIYVTRLQHSFLEFGVKCVLITSAKEIIFIMQLNAFGTAVGGSTGKQLACLQQVGVEASCQLAVM